MREKERMCVRERKRKIVWGRMYVYEREREREDAFARKREKKLSIRPLRD